MLNPRWTLETLDMGLKDMAKTQIDIEALLVWAYRDQDVLRAAGFTGRMPGPAGYKSSWVGFDHLERLGCFVDGILHASAARDLGTSAHDDAVVVHNAVLDLDDAFVEIREGEEVVLWDRALIADQGAELIEPRGGALLRWPDGRIARLERVVVSTILILHAKAGLRPETYEEWRVGSDGKIRDRSGHFAGEDAPILADIHHHRAVYAVWHAALGVLAADLAGAMERWEVTAPAASESPWLKAPKAAKPAKNAPGAISVST